MDFRWILIFVVLIDEICHVSVQETRVSLEIPSETSTWGRAVTNQTSACSVFGGDILENISDARASVHSTELNRPAWVGAYVHYTPWIKIIGCRLVKPSDLQTVSRAIHRKDQDNSVISCERKCQTLFALSEFHCFCLSSFPVSTGNCIPTHCPGNLNDFCGSNGDNYLSNTVTDVIIYETDASIPTNTTGAGECLVVEYTRDVVLSAYNKIVRGFQNPNDMSCSTENGFICKLEGAVIVDLSRQHYNRPTRTWNDAIRQCYKQNGYQISTDVESVVQNNSELSYFEKAWIGAFRRHHGFTISTKADSSSNIHCVAATVDVSGRITLSYRNCNDKLPVWCLESNQSSAIPVTSLITAETTSSLVSSKLTSHSQLPTTESNSASIDSAIVGTTSDKDLVITTSILATLLGLGILITIAVFLRKFFIKAIERKNGRSFRPSRSNRKVKYNHSHYEQQLSAIDDEPIYSVIIDKNLEAPRYSEVVESDILRAKRSNNSPYAYVNTRTLSESSTTDTQQRRSGYFEMRPKKKSRNRIELSWLKFLEREQERLNRMSVGRLSTTTERQSYVDMSLENSALRKSQASMKTLMVDLSNRNSEIGLETSSNKAVVRKDQGYIETIPGGFLKRNTQLYAEMPLNNTSPRKSTDYIEMPPDISLSTKNQTYNEILLDISPRKSLGYTDMSLDHVGLSATKAQGHPEISLDDLSETQSQGYSSIAMLSGEASHSIRLHGTDDVTSKQLPVEQEEHCKDFTQDETESSSMDFVDNPS